MAKDDNFGKYSKRDIEDAKEFSKSIAEGFSDLSKGISDAVGKLARAGKLTQDMRLSSDKTKRNFEELADINKQIANTQEDIARGNKTDIAELERRLQKSKDYTKELVNQAKVLEKSNNAEIARAGRKARLKATLRARDVQSQIQQQIRMAQAVQGSTVGEGAGRIGNFLGRISNGAAGGTFRNIATEVRKSRAEILSSGKALGSFGGRMAQVGGIVRGVAGKAGPYGLLLYALKAIGDAFLGADRQAVTLSRSLGLNAKNAEILRKQLTATANIGAQLSTAAANSDNVAKAFAEANKILGVSLGASIELNKSEKARLAALTDINERLGLSEQSMMGLISLASINLTTEDEILNTIAGQTQALSYQNSIQFNTKDILEEVLQTSTSIGLQFDFSTEALAKAVMNAKLLGFSLSDIEKTQSSLLNFQSSISDELQAEILIGRSLNLEKARTLALQGDLQGLGEEIYNQLGSLDEFNKLIPIQQEALAKTFGMSRAELGDIFKQQANIARVRRTYQAEEFQSLIKRQLGEKALENGREENILLLDKMGYLTKEHIKSIGADTLANLKREDATKRFQRAIDSLKDILVRLVSSGAIDTLAGKLETIALAIQGGASLFDIFTGNAGSAVEKGRQMRLGKARAGMDSEEQFEFDKIQAGKMRVAATISTYEEALARTGRNKLDAATAKATQEKLDKLVKVMEEVRDSEEKAINLELNGEVVTKQLSNIAMKLQTKS